MLFSSMKPEQVFTPRLAEVNKEMYVSRPHLEKELKTGLRGHLHLIIHGESGTGKSWLYKQTFQNNSVSFMVANLANASRLGSISAELKNLVDREEKSEKTAYSEAKSAGLNAGVAKADIAHTGQYQIGKMEPFEACLKHLHEISDGKPSVLVFDNLETAFTDPLLKELADLITLCDDERYSKYKVKILIVGVPSGVKEYFYKTPHHATVANRLVELPEVTRLEKAECDALVSRGFTEKLKYKIDDIQSLLQHVGWITDRAPQVVHEYCLELAFLCEDSHRITSTSISQADDDWLKNRNTMHTQ